MTDRFRWHPEARLFGPDATEQALGSATSAILPDRPGPGSLAGALARAIKGESFRIGATELASPDPAGRTPVFETLTSGSTGVPRRIRRTQASWTASFSVNAGQFGIEPGTVVAVPGRLSQSLALYGALEALHLGATLHLLDGLRPDRMATALARHRVEVLYATPAQLRLLLDAPGPTATELRLVLCGGAKLDPGTIAALATRYPDASLREFYGTAEASFISIWDAASPPHSVGLPYPGVEVDLRGPQGAREVWVRSPYLFQRYAADLGQAQWQDGWLSTGELAHWEGPHLVIDGRIDRMVTVADQNVCPEELERFLLAQPGVTRAVAVPRPDGKRGHVLDAIVEGGDAEALLRACRQGLGPIKAPRRLHRTADWPLLPSGKTDLAALQRQLG
jgi:long-chain acyl-CoA synthetase